MRDQRQTGRESLEWTPQELYDKIQDIDSKLIYATGSYATRLKNQRERYASMIDEINGWDQVRLSDRDTESVSNRALLANALESVTKHEVELKRLREYKENVEMLDAEEKKLSELNAQIKELSFAKGPRDKAKISKLRDEAIKTKNMIDIYDKRLLSLEAAAPLQRVLEREKKKAYDRAAQKGEEALKKQRAEIEITMSASCPADSEVSAEVRGALNFILCDSTKLHNAARHNFTSAKPILNLKQLCGDPH